MYILGKVRALLGRNLDILRHPAASGFSGTLAAQLAVTVFVSEAPRSRSLFDDLTRTKSAKELKVFFELFC